MRPSHDVHLPFDVPMPHLHLPKNLHLSGRRRRRRLGNGIFWIVGGLALTAAVVSAVMYWSKARGQTDDQTVEHLTDSRHSAHRHQSDLRQTSYHPDETADGGATYRQDVSTSR